MRKLTLAILSLTLLALAGFAFAESTKTAIESSDVKCMKQMMEGSSTLSEAYQACSIKK